MYKILPKERLDIVQYYLNNGSTLKETASKFHVNYRTVFKWVKLYKKEGEARLLRTYKRPWNRTKRKIEERIALLKERNPAITIRRAKEELRKQGVCISLKGIWGIWKRYGYAGFIKEELGHDFTGYIPWSKEAKSEFQTAKEVFKSGKVKEVAEILNSIPSLPTNKLLSKLPDNFLNWKRKVEKMSCLMGEIPPRSYIKMGEKLYNELKEKKLNHSVLRIGVMWAVARNWIAPSEEILEKINVVKQIANPAKGRRFQYTHMRTPELLFGPRFSLLVEEGITYTKLLKLRKAFETAEICRKLLRYKKIIAPLSLLQLGIMYMNLEDYKKAENFIVQAYNKIDDEEKKRLRVRLANLFVSKGDWRAASRFSRDAAFDAWGALSGKYLFFSRLALIKGDLRKSITLGMKVLTQLRREKLEQRIFSSFFTIASAYAGMGERIKAKKLLTKILPFFKKRKLKKYIHIIEILLCSNKLKFKNQKSKMRNKNDVFNPLSSSLNSHLNKDLLPSVRLALLIKNGDYIKALSYAKKKYLMLHFYRYIFFFPETGIDLFKKGKPTGLPRAIRRLPVFNKNIPVFHIKFLGHLVVYKNQKYLKVKLKPMDTAFLIVVASRAAERGKFIKLEDVYRNFWPNSENPSRNLSHLLVRIKKLLKMPRHLLTVSTKTGYPVLLNDGVYFTTDYQEFEQNLVHGKALERAGEWGFARREYLRAFKLFRAEPFKKMYDNWSENMRGMILNRLKTETINFAKSCLEHKHKKDGKKVLEKVSKMIPHSKEVKEILGDDV